MTTRAWKPTGSLAQFEGDLELMRELIGIFLNETPGQIQVLRSAAIAVDFGALNRVSHSLKGSALQLNATRLAELSAEIEHAAQQQVARAYVTKVECLRAEFLELRQALIAYLNSAEPPGAMIPGTDSDARPSFAN